VPTRPLERSNRRQDRAFASPHPPSWYKSGRGAKPSRAQATNPIGVFSSFISCECAVRGGEKGAPPLRRAEEEQVRRWDVADAPRSEAAPVITRKGEETVRIGEGAGPEQEQLRRRRERLRHRERLRRATVYPEPATTTPSTRCERRLNPLHLFPSLAPSLC
jgi:hypothetical protein